MPIPPFGSPPTPDATSTVKGKMKLYDEDTMTSNATDGAATQQSVKAYVDASSGGQTLYDAVVAPSGGDYTDIATAISTEGANSSIFIAPGTYNIDSSIAITQAGITLTGAGWNTVIKAVTNDTFDMLHVTGANFQISDLKIDGNNPTVANIRGLRINAADPLVKNLHVDRCDAQCIILEGNADNGLVEGCRVTNVDAQGIQNSGDNVKVIGNYINHTGADVALWHVSGNNCVYASNTIDCTNTAPHGMEVGDVVGFSNVTISNNTIVNAATNGIYVWSNSLTNADGANNITIDGNTITNTGQHGIKLWRGVRYSVVSNNVIKNSSQTTDNTYSDIFLQSTNATTRKPEHNLIIGNLMRASASNKSKFAVEETGGDGDHNIVTGNKCLGQNGSISIEGTHSQAYDNIVDVHYHDKKLEYLKNTSGGALAAGDIVILKSVAAGNEVTTTTTAGDTKVYGMAAEAISDNAFGYIQVHGKTTKLKVDGTTDIAIGDFISAFTTAGIGQKASSGNTAIAIALEAYATNDSNGVIDALIISPRQV